jgi:glycosyltransferase involved in cell wall biosynthesis
MTVRVSILLPTLNRRSCLDGRIKSIVTQTLTDWEVVAVDSHSDDGTWEALQRWAAKDSRVRPFQAPRGLYAAWNRAIELARGEFVYIAASDDSMSPDFLGTLVTGLGEHPECDLAHCKLRIVDGSGNPHPVLSWDRFYSTLYFGELIDQRHIRLAPHDGLLHCGVRTVYTAASQILVRRALFCRIGGFRTDFGSVGDYEWGMRASLVANILHIPSYLATWRLHEGQATEFGRIDSAAYFQQLARHDAISPCDCPKDRPAKPASDSLERSESPLLEGEAPGKISGDQDAVGQMDVRLCRYGLEAGDTAGVLEVAQAGHSSRCTRRPTHI